MLQMPNVSAPTSFSLLRRRIYTDAHNTLITEINTVIPIDAVRSIDGLTCKLDAKQRANLGDLFDKIKTRISKFAGPHVTCSIGFTPNRHLAKIAGKQDKPFRIALTSTGDTEGFVSGTA
jgi:nucleotidyltransferase/DNA polymerase involved in DNA repair